MIEKAESQQWLLRKHDDGSVFGPMPFAQLAQWAAAAQIAPHDSVSVDAQTWMKAPMLPQLGMDWLVEVTMERYYGPTTLGAIHEFICLGEINEETFVINTLDGTRRQISDIAVLLEPCREARAAESADQGSAIQPAAAGMAIDSAARIRELEQALREERRALAELEQRYRALQSKHLESTAAGR